MAQEPVLYPQTLTGGPGGPQKGALVGSGHGQQGQHPDLGTPTRNGEL